MSFPDSGVRAISGLENREPGQVTMVLLASEGETAETVKCDFPGL